MEQVVPDLHLAEFVAWMVKRGYSEKSAREAARKIRLILAGDPRPWRQQTRSNYRWALRHYFKFLDEEVISGGQD